MKNSKNSFKCMVKKELKKRKLTTIKRTNVITTYWLNMRKLTPEFLAKNQVFGGYNSPQSFF
ncbi:hypothetical protein PL92145974 [Planktothrix tepida PCC 9214]|uniref:Uncharacterized protein n=1 Tax=Planktothrix tepida PCC 9214 TaxID=671072 RepID=A0A1J1LVM8_9CYAN|nr:hypothetical protein PL92145974 [Planktothrix tepida PCC 9214]